MPLNLMTVVLSPVSVSRNVDTLGKKEELLDLQSCALVLVLQSLLGGAVAEKPNCVQT